MLRTSMPQKQHVFPKRNDLMSIFSSGHSIIEPPHIIKTMMKIIKTKSKDSMDMETQIQFFKIADAVLRMAEEVKE